MTIADATALRDPSWVKREAGYHAHAIGEVNLMLRKYNGLAPPTVRRGYHSVEAELARVYEDGAAEILQQLRDTTGTADGGVSSGKTEEEEEDQVKAWDGIDVALPKLKDLWRSWVGRLFNRR
jgi:DnaJ family protein C protein 28